MIESLSSSQLAAWILSTALKLVAGGPWLVDFDLPPPAKQRREAGLLWLSALGYLDISIRDLCANLCLLNTLANLSMGAGSIDWDCAEAS